MKLSVVIPVYNGGNFIEKSYYSIINQKVDDFEILYVNNNSKDTSVENIQKFSKKDVRVKLFHQTKQGTAAARNMGISEAKGDYVYIFDVDDEIYPDALNKMISVLDDQNDVDAVFGKMVKSHKGIEETVKPQDETNTIVLNEKPYWGLAWFSDLSIVVGPPAFLYRRAVFNKIGGYNEAIKNTEDTAFDIKLGMTCNVAFLDTYIYLYFKHAASTIEMAKVNENLVAMHWTRFIYSHLPFYLENKAPLKYKELLYSYVYKTIGKRVYHTKGFSVRNSLRKELLLEIRPMQLPLLLQLHLVILTIFPISFILKVYVHYLVPFFIKKSIEKL